MKALFFLVVSAFILTARSNESQTPFSFREDALVSYFLLRAIRPDRARVPYFVKLPRLLRAAFFFHPQADGGSDGGGDGGSGGGGSDGGSGTGDGGDGSGGDGSDSGDAGSGASDSSGSASDSTDPGDNGDPDADPSATDNNGVADISAPSVLDTVTTLDFAAQQSYDAVANPFGGVPSTVPLQNGTGAEPVPGSPSGPRSPGSPGREPEAVPPPQAVNPPAQARAQIHAVIVSDLADPSQVLWGNVNLTGGIVALGSPDSATPQTAGRWDPNVRITPDPELLNGNKIPPLVPNVFDVRIMHHEVSATVLSEGSISGRSEPASNNAGRDGP